ncbi:MAG TPA: glycosyltransferase family 4 protein [Chloroflexi bacterium]|nr:glycosyltransferase family 4 protein [Chloroflexota bacterium]
MRVCYFGTYDADYVRNVVAQTALRSQGVDVVACHATVWNSTDEKVADARKGPLNPRLWLRLLRAYGRLVRQHRAIGRYDAMIVGYPGHLDLFLARVLTWLRRAPLVFDAYVSLYDTIVGDRALVQSRSLLGVLSRWIDRTTCRLADAVLLDTRAHIELFRRAYGLSATTFAHIWVGADAVYQAPAKERDEAEPFRVLYFGKFIPLHGVDTVIRAAKLLEAEGDIRFEMIGGGQERAQAEALAASLGVTTVDWGPEWLEPEALRRRIEAADVCLGIFGRSDKAARVIPTKAYIALAMGKPLVTRDSPAARELLTPDVHALLCAPGDPAEVAGAILALRRDPALRRKIGRAGRAMFLTRCSTEAIGRSLVRVLRTVLRPAPR